MIVADVSVVVPCFNCSLTVDRAVKSIVEQTLSVREIILINDFSGDDTSKKLHSIKDNYRDVEVVIIDLTKNVGAGEARNIGWNIAKGKYIAFLDADDSWHHQKIELQYLFMEKNPNFSFTAHATDVCNSGGACYSMIEQNEELKGRPISAQKLLLKNFFSTPTVMLLRKLPNRFPVSKRHAEDYHLWCDIILDGNECFLIQKSLAFLHKGRYGVGGLSASLWKMELGEIDMYKSLMLTGKVSYLYGFLLINFSLLKFIKRFITINMSFGFAKAR